MGIGGDLISILYGRVLIGGIGVNGILGLLLGIYMVFGVSTMKGCSVYGVAYSIGVLYIGKCFCFYPKFRFGL